MITDIISEFQSLAESGDISLHYDIQPGVQYLGDEAAIRRLVSILLDNAIKYCDPGGEIKVLLRKKLTLVLSIENTYTNVEELELDKLFDRFYRADRARPFDGGFGIGLSIAKSIVHRYHGEIVARKKSGGKIEFRVKLK